MSNHDANEESCTIPVETLLELINKRRKHEELPPVEHSAIVSRTTLRFNMNKERNVDFAAEKVTLTAQDVEELEQLFNELFDCRFEGEVRRACAKLKPKKERPREVTPLPDELVMHSREGEGEESGTGVMGRVKKIFGIE